MKIFNAWLFAFLLTVGISFLCDVFHKNVGVAALFVALFVMARLTDWKK